MSRMLLVGLAAVLSFGRGASAVVMNYNFSERFQTFSLSGELVGLNLDANGNGTNVDPAQVLLFSVPPNVGITASPGNPYVFVPQTYQQYSEDPVTHIVTLDSTTTPGTYGFNVQTGNILQSPLDLTMADASNVELFFNAGSFTTQVAPEYGITADGPTDYFWPTVDSSISYTPVAVPEPVTVPLVAAVALGLLARRRTASRRGRSRVT